MVYFLPKETRSPVSSEEEGWAVKFHLEAHIDSTEWVQHASLRVWNPTSPIVGGGENYTYHNLHVWEATNSGDTFSCSWMHSLAFGLCVIPQCLSVWEKNEDPVLMALPLPRSPDGDTMPNGGLSNYNWLGWEIAEEKVNVKKYFLFSLSTTHPFHARVLLHKGRSNRKSPQSKHGRNTTVQSWVWQTHHVALTNLIGCLTVLRAFPTTWGLDGRCIFHLTSLMMDNSPRHCPLHKQLSTLQVQGKPV